ncbi:DAK2 domain-containing protein (plasmid) [Sinorhizobium meliloti]|nr:DAK2 domain-containing protein [Sinorhizobium meliloti]
MQSTPPPIAACFMRGSKASGRSARQGGRQDALDTLVPAVDAFDAAAADGKPFAEALDPLVSAAEAGRDSTRDLVAKIGRASRLGERSLGVLDAAPPPAAIILRELSHGARARLA